jgi:hypothetical protein
MKRSLYIEANPVRAGVVVSTLTDVGTTSKADLAELYLRRWNAELDLRNIKITMQMEILSCKSPAMARKEIWAYLLAYNLIRKIIANAALKHRINPRSISFKGSIQILNAYRCAWIYNSVLSGPDVYPFRPLIFLGQSEYVDCAIREGEKDGCRSESTDKGAA